MVTKRYYSAAFMAALLLVGIPDVFAQQKIGYVDSDFILSNTAEYRTVQQQLDRIAADWNKELDDQRKKLDDQFREYQARELLYTNEERQKKRDEIVRAEENLEKQRARYFGPDGEIFAQQEQLMRPIQERILEAIDEVATQEGFDYIFDKTGDFLFLFAREQWDISIKVLEELGIDTENISTQRNARRPN